MYLCVKSVHIQKISFSYNGNCGNTISWKLEFVRNLHKRKKNRGPLDSPLSSFFCISSNFQNLGMQKTDKRAIQVNNFFSW